ncbi:hypothetical protein [Gelidibacter salicanalis]|uniref:ABM domain-containing protein n=1 Tax=Gelidibacter salicanalis TaxID=291193 RepID=A0A934KT14_9FLAO|nr:hypothetical protein [Gelidibacter salicanalis]MBJ7881510.1 hypothetical protein [Gelidibacter salicanalis]
MKTIKGLFVVLAGMLLLNSTSTIAQEQTRPEFVTITTMHWNMDNKDFKMEEWKAVEKEYLDKVTMNNEHVANASFYLHRMTPDNTEILYAQSYPSWEAMGKAADRNTELEKSAWPDEKARTAFMKKRDAYYSPKHSDEIYATMPHAKRMTTAPTKDMICYVRKGHFAYGEGNNEEFEATSKEYFDNVTSKNEYIKAYYPMAHAWGSDRTESVEAFFLDSMADLDKMFDRDTELFESHWKDEAARKGMEEKSAKYFDGRHGDYVYTYVAGLAK